MITEEIVRDVAEAVVSDDCRVELYVAELRKNRSASLTARQARDLAAELVRAAQEAERGAADLLRDVESAGFDVIEVSPDCVDGKHAACIGEAWSLDRDELTACTCTCHSKAVEA